MLFVSPSRVFLVLLRLILCFLCPPSRVFLVLLRDTTSQGTREGRLPLKKPSSKETKRGAAALTGCVPYQRPLKEPSSKETKRGAAHRTQPLKKPSSKETKRGGSLQKPTLILSLVFILHKTRDTRRDTCFAQPSFKIFD